MTKSQLYSDDKKIFPVGTPFSINNLPKVSSWPAKLLNRPDEIFYKSKSEILREFDQEKWGKLFDSLSKCSENSLNNLEHLMFSDIEDIIYCFKGKFFKSTPINAYKLYKKILENELSSNMTESCLVEIGSGAGNLIIHLAKYFSSTSSYMAYELTKAGRAITEMVARREQVIIDVEYLDFDDGCLISKPPHDAVVFSSFAMVYCKNPEKILKSLIARKPKEILLIEPIYQMFDENTLIGLISKRYFEVNDYSIELYPVIKKLESQRLLNCVSIKKNYFAHNPLCPVSVLRLRPA